MSISIVIPTIGSPFREIIKESLISALASDPKLWNQIIIVDNARNKEFTSFLNDCLNKDPRVEIHSVNEELSIAECWNYGLKLVKNEWHLYLHDDDILKPNSIHESDLSSKVGFINFGFEVFGSESWTYIPKDSGLSGVLRNTPKFVSTLIHTHSLKELGGWDTRAGYFLDFLGFILLDQKFGSKAVNKCTGKYRLHSSNASQKAQRNEKYGDALPYVLSKCFESIKDENIRRELIFATVSFAYPNHSTKQKLISNFAKAVGLKAWVN